MIKIFRPFLSIHFVAVACLLAYMLDPLTWPFKMPEGFWIKQYIEYLMLAVLYVVNILFFAPKLLSRSKGVIYLLVVSVAVYLLVIANGWVVEHVYIKDVLAKKISFYGKAYLPNATWEAKWAVFMSIVMLALSNIAAFANRLQKNKLAFAVSEKERISAELAFLKAQINPHFFFNSLHTTYALMDTDTAAAKESLYTLSHMMRYVIYETKNDLTTLTKEINFIEDYITLMKARIPQNVQVIFDKQQGMQDVQIAPMLFLPFVENAFKHGIRATQPSYVLIEVSEQDKAIRLEVKNSLFEKSAAHMEENSGIGIANTRRRLDLLYSGKYELGIEKDEHCKEYIVVLKLYPHDH